MKIDHDKFWIKSFFDFQYGSNGTIAYKAKVSAMSYLKKYGIEFNENMEVLGKTSEDLCKSIGIGTSTGTSTGRGGVGEKPIKLDFESLYAKYPRKLGKKAGLMVCKNAIKTPEALLAAHKAVDRYSAFIRSEKREPKHILYFSTFMNSWEDWLDESTGSVVGAIKQRSTIEIVQDYERRLNESRGFRENNGQT